jgi:hypothetical protein
MSFDSHRFMLVSAALAFVATACSTGTVHVADVGRAPRTCAGGVIQIANDAKHYAGCSEVFGNLRIEDAAISDLHDLASLRTVHGALVVTRNEELTNLHGLEHLEAVSHLELSDNPQLRSMSELSALRQAPTVLIRNNPELESVRGLEGLERVESLALINDGIIQTAGLDHLRLIGELTVSDNPKLISLGGLNGVESARAVHIKNNRLLCAQLGLLPQLSEVSEALELSSNASVSKLEQARLLEQLKPANPPSNVAERELALH